MFFLIFLHDDRSFRIRIKSMIRIRIQTSDYVDLVYADPE
jgi:hypothetical protein